MSMPAIASMMTPRRRLSSAWVMPRASAGLLRDDGCDDRRRAESRADAGEAVVCFDADERRITLDLGSKIGAVTLFLRNGCRHWNCGHFDDFHGSLFPVSRSHLDFGWPS